MQINEDVESDPTAITKEVVNRAVCKLRKEKAAGEDERPERIDKADGEKALRWVLNICIEASHLSGKKIPSDQY